MAAKRRFGPADLSPLPRQPIIAPIGCRRDSRAAAELRTAQFQEIDWDFPGGARRRLRVEAVMNQPRLRRIAEARGRQTG
jgi:hypothetical protein